MKHMTAWLTRSIRAVYLTVASTLVIGVQTAEALDCSTAGYSTQTVNGRSVLVYNPGGSNKAAIIALHGAGGNMDGYRRKTQYSAYADETSPNAMVVIPQGRRQNPLSSRGWAGGHCCVLDDQHAFTDVYFLDDLIGELKNCPSVDPNEIYMSGVSTGGAMVHRYVAEGSHSLAGAASLFGPFSGYRIDGKSNYDRPWNRWTPDAPDNKVLGNYIYIHGKDDVKVPFGAGWSNGGSGQRYDYGFIDALENAKNNLGCTDHIVTTPDSDTTVYTAIGCDTTLIGGTLKAVAIDQVGHDRVWLTWPTGYATSQYILKEWGLLTRTETEKTVFVTSTRYDGNLVDEAYALAGIDPVDAMDAGNILCQDRADAAGLEGAFSAWLSQSNAGIWEKTAWSILPLKTLANATVGNNSDALWYSTIPLINPIQRDEFNNIVSSATGVWTGTDADAAQTANLCRAGGTGTGGWDSASLSVFGTTGSASRTDDRWVENATASCYSMRRLYCIEQ